MSEFLHTKSFLLLVYSNKNSQLFNRAASKVVNEYDNTNKIGILYDDFDANDEIKKEWEKKYKNIQIKCIAPRRTTLRMDDKIYLSKYMFDSKYIPKCYTKKEDIPIDVDNNKLFYVKRRGSTGARGVYLYKYSDLLNIDCTDCIIQENSETPHLYEDRRYKMRVYVLLHNNNVYMNKKAWCSLALKDYELINDETTNDDMNAMNIIYQCPGRKWFEFKSIEQHEDIFENLKLSCFDFKNTFQDQINNINDKFFTLLGFDYVVDSNLDVKIIEINHRSNYAHPKDIVDNVDVPVLEDTMRVLIQNNTTNTDYTQI
jgi:hypothetical protein